MSSTSPDFWVRGALLPLASAALVYIGTKYRQLFRGNPNSSAETAILNTLHQRRIMPRATHFTSRHAPAAHPTQSSQPVQQRLTTALRRLSQRHEQQSGVRRPKPKSALHHRPMASRAEMDQYWECGRRQYCAAAAISEHPVTAPSRLSSGERSYSKRLCPARALTRRTTDDSVYLRVAVFIYSAAGQAARGRRR